MARPQAADHGNKRQAILDAAARSFAERGYAGTSMSNIASRASGSKAWLYHYYDSKDAILDDLLTGFLRSLLDVTAAAVDLALPPHERLRCLLGDVVRLCDASPGQLDLFEASNSLPAATRNRLRRMRVKVLSAIDQAIVEAEPRLARDPATRQAVVQSVLGMLHWRHRWIDHPNALTVDQWAEVATELVLGGAAVVAETIAASMSTSAPDGERSAVKRSAVKR